MDKKYRMKNSKPLHNNEDIVPEGERACPICGESMVIKRKRGVSIDVCEEHGVWMDRGEMGKIIERIRKRDALAYEKMLKKAKLEESSSWAVFCLLSLVPD
jgi:Zn-finger nucleic acid-binding protein